VWLGAFVYCCDVVIVYSISFFLPALIAQFGFSDIISNLLTVPVHAGCFIAVILNGLHSDRTEERYFHILIPNIIGLICWGIEAYSLETDNIALQYSMCIIATIASTMGSPVALVWPLDFTVGSTTAAVAPGIIVGIGNLGGIIGPQLFGISKTFGGSYTWGALSMALCCFLCILLSTIQWVKLKAYKSNEEEEYLLRKKRTPVAS